MKKQNKKNKAQGTIEYLVIIAIIVVIGLIVIQLSLNLFDSESVSNTSNKIGSKIGSGSISVLEAVADNNSLVIALSSLGTEGVNLTKIIVDGVENNYDNQYLSNTRSFLLNELSNNCVCESEQTSRTCAFQFTYITRDGLTKTTDTLNITIDCTTNINQENPNYTQPIILDCYDETQDPIPICTLSDLNRIRDDLSANYKLMNNIDASSTSTWNSEEGWEPIGDGDEYFTGTFDGQNFEISNLYINRTSNYVGLFGWTVNTISNLGLTDVNITGSSGVGGISGRNHTTINNSYVSGNISANNKIGGISGFNFSTITNSYSNANITGVYEIGGIVGYNDRGTIILSYSTGNITGTGDNIGGICGRNAAGPITKSYSTGNVFGEDKIGGLLGYNDGGTISNSYATGNIVASGSSIGGLIGSTTGGAINYSYSIGEASGISNIGGLVGSNFSGSATNSYWNSTTSGLDTSALGEGKTTSEMMQEETFVDWNFDTIWQIQEDTTYPYLIDNTQSPLPQ